MKLLSEELVSSEYRERLQRDLSHARICRFLVAYVSEEGLNSLGRDPLIHALRDDYSFGVSSLTCACGYEPLLGLQDQLGRGSPRLKYFMDPLISEADEPDEITLFHSKLVYLLLEREGKSVVYIGSHNWSQRALGPRGPRNAEASLRFESDFAPEHLAGVGATVAGQVNYHLMQAYSAPACLPATRANEPIFAQWYQKGCGRSRGASMDQATVILAVVTTLEKPPDPGQWQSLITRGIYVQTLEDEEGTQIWEGGDPIIVLVWNSLADLHAGGQPLLLLCRETTHKAGPDSRRRGTNQATAPIAGFKAVIFDESQLLAMQQSSRVGPRSSTTLWSGRPVQFYNFEFPTQRSDSGAVDAGVTPRYQFHLEVESVIFPADGDHPEDASAVWTRESFAVADSPNAAKVQKIPGYQVSLELADEIMRCLTETLRVDPKRARVLPVSPLDDPKIGKRLSAHSLHETFIRPQENERRGEFYLRAKPGALVADLGDGDDTHMKTSSGQLSLAGPECVERVQRVYITRLERLQEWWQEIAEQARRSSSRG